MNRSVDDNFIIKSVLIVQFISLYAKFEKKLVNIFKEEIKKVDHKHKNKLYFMHGALLSSNIVYKYDMECFEIQGSNKSWSYDENSIFNTLNLNKILRFERKENLIEQFRIKIQSIQRSIIQHDFKDSAIKLLEMRNKLAHEFDYLRFDDKCIIELLSAQTIKEHIENYSWLSGYDYTSMDEVSISLFSNYVYMNKLLDVIEKDTRAPTI